MLESRETFHPTQFWIDVGGTFTDCLGIDEHGRIEACKVLSSGVVKGKVSELRAGEVIVDPSLAGYPDAFFNGYQLRCGTAMRAIDAYDAASGELRLAEPIGIEPGERFEISSGEPAPVMAIRLLRGLKLHDPIGAASVRLGTTRGTNALLERRGARTAFITTKGFGDILLIANQDRPRLFELNIQKPDPLFERAAEIDERISASGEVLETIELDSVQKVLEELLDAGVESLAICLLNAYRNPESERAIADAAARLGFNHVSISSEVSPTIKIVSRGDTTVVDAYLTPVVRDYVRAISGCMPEAKLMLMTSAGGLTAAETCAGKDMILSGPAGGVVGVAGVARAAGFDRAIGFDMGGTSTDVCRFEGEFGYEYETMKAGVRIAAPMLAIETVAAGGGSICDFDGQKLVVGPRSAGAEPGPACYGKGGPLALTDVNVLLGRVLPEFFPFALDIEAARGRLAEMQARIETDTGKRMSELEIAEGFARIADASMAAAIKKISVARGYDVREYALVAFGGAAGQHACAVARELGMRRALVHPYASVMSAYGMGLADVRKFAVRTLLAPLSEATLRDCATAFEAMESALAREMSEEGIEADRVENVRRLEARYAGQSSTIVITGAAAADHRAEFECMHRQLYGHIHAGREIEVVAARCEVIASMRKHEAAVANEQSRKPAADRVEMVAFGGAMHDTGVFDRGALKPGDEIAGPALVVEPMSTTVVAPGWSARVTGRGDLLLTDESGGREERVAAEADPVMLEIFNNHFAAIAEQMGVTLQRTSLSVNVKERLDFSCAVFTPEGDLVANAPHLPVHLGAMSECVKRVLRDVPGLKSGDVIATNDPMRGGSHLPDVTLVMPVFDAKGERILFFTASRAHHAEIGGVRPGSMPPDSKCLAEEGVVIRNFKAIDGGEPKFVELRELLATAPYPSRAPDENIADIGAQIAANQTGAAALLAMIERYSLETTHAYMRHIQSAAEAKVRAAIARLQDGEYRFEDALDTGDRICVCIAIEGDRARVNFTGTSPVMRGNQNANRAIVNAAVIYCFRLLIDEDIPLNQGVLAPVEIVLPECFLNPPERDDPRESAAVAGGNVETSQRVVDVILGALGLAAASQGTMNNLTFGNEGFGYYETICGGAGAGPGFRGADAVHTHMTNTRLTDPETLEAQYPVRVRRFAIRRGSGGAGQWRGGDGAIRELEFLEPLQVSILSNRRTTRPFGLAGGSDGAAGMNTVIRADGGIEELRPVATFEARAGDRLVIETPGGGGYGEIKDEGGRMKDEKQR